MEETLMTDAAQPNEGAEQTEQQSTESQAQTGEQAATEQAEDTQSEQKPEAPEKYEFKAPEGREFDTEFMKSFEETARELDLSQDKAQKLIDKLSPVMEQRQMQKVEAVIDGWEESSRTDKEFGGDKLEENLGIAKKALDQFGSDELRQLLGRFDPKNNPKGTGLGNHPEVIRMLYKAGKAISPDTFVGGHKEGGTTSAPKTFNDMANKLYG